MNKTKLTLLFAALTVLISCKDKTTENIDESRYSGSNFTANIRTTRSRTPDEERMGFKLPPGFEIQLYASEPDIGKPINIAFDAKGRMWVTQSFEYPFPSVPGKGRDHLTILEDTDQDGRADRFIQFADTLNIPIGILPVADGAVAYSIPYIYKFTDANGDGKPESSKKLLGPFKTKDTHGMINNFVRGYDGWIHSCHGFTNRDTIAGADGDPISMISGNTFRFRPDGSRVEHTTDGRINPFGLAYDEMGYLYSTDCHTSPLYQLIRGADYTQWGKEEGMGFAPDMKSLSDEATALAGLSYYADSYFPSEYQQNFYVGDVVRCRIYRYSHTTKGATPIGKREPDFMLSEDPWFRPVDVKVGPDGALYVADFYNSIIGHYEVPLDHPSRDHIRGRIWRITYKGRHNKITDWTKASVDELLHALDLDNMPVRMTAADQLTDRIGQQAVAPTLDLFNGKDISPRQYIHGLWVLERLHALPAELLKRSAADTNALIRLHSMRILAEEPPDTTNYYPLVLKALHDKDVNICRAAVELMVKYPSMRSLQNILSIRKTVPLFDTHLLYTTRLCLRTLLRNESLMKQALATNWDETDATSISDVMTGVALVDAGTFLYNYARQYDIPATTAPSIFRHMARYIPPNRLDGVVEIAMRNKSTAADSLNMLLFEGLQEGFAQKGIKENVKLIAWGKQLATSIMDKYPANTNLSITKLTMQTFAAGIAGTYKMTAFEPLLKAYLVQPSIVEDANGDREELHNRQVRLKISAIRALLEIDPQNTAGIVLSILNDPSSEMSFKNDIGGMLGDYPASVINKILPFLKSAPPDLQLSITTSLAGTAEGREVIFAQVKKGTIPARTLIMPRVQERILMNISRGQREHFMALTSHLDPVDKERQSVIYSRLAMYDAALQSKRPSADSGKMVFVQNCSPCHSIAGKGGSIGPNLDGINQWGAKALAEKVLDPNRSISENFRNYTIRMKDGQVLNGLYRRDEGAVIVFANAGGQEFSLSKAEIAEQVPAKFTLMPDDFRNRLSQNDFNSLVYFLTTRKN